MRDDWSVLRDLDEGGARSLVQEYLDAMDPPGSDVWVITRVAGRELAPGHPLHGRPAQALAKCGHCDSVLFPRLAAASRSFT
jgi:hypothetical protein